MGNSNNKISEAKVMTSDPLHDTGLSFSNIKSLLHSLYHLRTSKGCISWQDKYEMTQEGTENINAIFTHQACFLYKRSSIEQEEYFTFISNRNNAYIHPIDYMNRSSLMKE